jgi:hypothetical protein
MESKQQVLAARLVLEDCKYVMRMYRDQSSGEPLRVVWVAALSVLRGVYHVVHEIDASRDAITKK